MSEREALARRWHEMSDHAADGTPFGGPLCNCDKVADRLARLLADAEQRGAARVAAAVEVVCAELDRSAFRECMNHIRRDERRGCVAEIRAALATEPAERVRAEEGER